MILNFSIGNFRSFNEIQTIDFRATGLVSESREVDENNIVELPDNRVLKVAGVYGANGSGKSNLIRGLSFLKRMLSNSLDSEGLLDALFSPFKLSSDFQNNNGYFQISLLLDNKKYRYGFTIKNEDSFSEEWLFGPAEKNETFYFKRKGREIELNKERFSEGDNLPFDKLRSDVLFLTFASSYNGEISKKIKGFITEKIMFENVPISVRGAAILRTELGNDNFTNRLIESGNKSIILEWLRDAGLIYEDIIVEKSEDKRRDTYIVSLLKQIFNNKGEVTGITPMLLATEESSGTRKFYKYIGRLYQLFSEGGALVVDEIDSNFHPALLLKLISFFNNPNLNKTNAQLLFTSHDTNLLDPNVLRRDQIYFTEKSQREATVLYSLADLKGIRNNADFAKQYLAGFYGALPVLSDYVTEEPLTQITAE